MLISCPVHAIRIEFGSLLPWLSGFNPEKPNSNSKPRKTTLFSEICFGLNFTGFTLPQKRADLQSSAQTVKCISVLTKILTTHCVNDIFQNLH